MLWVCPSTIPLLRNRLLRFSLDYRSYTVVYRLSRSLFFVNHPFYIFFLTTLMSVIMLKKRLLICKKHLCRKNLMVELLCESTSLCTTNVARFFIFPFCIDHANDDLHSRYNCEAWLFLHHRSQSLWIAYPEPPTCLLRSRMRRGNLETQRLWQSFNFLKSGFSFS